MMFSYRYMSVQYRGYRTKPLCMKPRLEPGSDQSVHSPAAGVAKHRHSGPQGPTGTADPTVAESTRLAGLAAGVVQHIRRWPGLWPM